MEVDESSAVVRLTGVLDTSAADMVRDALLARLCDRPGPVVADVTGLRVADPPGRGVFAEVRREVADWPAADLLLCDPAVSGPGRADIALAGVPAWPTLAGALAAVAAEPLAAVLTVELAPTVDAARQARELVADRLPKLGHADAGRAGADRGHRDGEQRGRARPDGDERPTGAAGRRHPAPGGAGPLPAAADVRRPVPAELASAAAGCC